MKQGGFSRISMHSVTGVLAVYWEGHACSLRHDSSFLLNSENFQQLQKPECPVDVQFGTLTVQHATWYLSGWYSLHFLLPLLAQLSSPFFVRFLFFSDELLTCNVLTANRRVATLTGIPGNLEKSGKQKMITEKSRNLVWEMHLWNKELDPVKTCLLFFDSTTTCDYWGIP